MNDNEQKSKQEFPTPVTRKSLYEPPALKILDIEEQTAGKPGTNPTELATVFGPS
jgi:hypothetical protein